MKSNDNLDLFKPYKEPNLLGVRLVRKPRKSFTCFECHKPIDDIHISMFGSAHGDHPYNIRLHIDCCIGQDHRIVKIKNEIEDKSGV